MEPRINLITLGVADLPRAVRFYRDGLGWPTKYKADEPIAFFKLTGTILSLYPLKELAADISPEIKPARTGFGGITLAHSVRTRAEVAVVLAQAETGRWPHHQAGAGRLLGRAQRLFQRPGQLLLGGGLESGRAPRRPQVYETAAMNPLFGRDITPRF